MTPEVSPLTTSSQPQPSPLAIKQAARARAMLLAEQASKEMNPQRLAALVEQLCRELDAANGRGRA